MPHNALFWPVGSQNLSCQTNCCSLAPVYCTEKLHETFFLLRLTETGFLESNHGNIGQKCPTMPFFGLLAVRTYHVKLTAVLWPQSIVLKNCMKHFFLLRLTETGFLESNHGNIGQKCPTMPFFGLLAVRTHHVKLTAVLWPQSIVLKNCMKHFFFAQTYRNWVFGIQSWNHESGGNTEKMSGAGTVLVCLTVVAKTKNQAIR